MTDLETADALEGAVQVVAEDAAQVAIATRAQSEIQSAIIVAKRFPRDVTGLYAALMKASKRATFARKARYSFPRGGQEVAGPSVNLAREAARCWGNVRFGLSLIPTVDDEDWIHIEAFAHDCETNSYVTVQDKFPNKVYRKKEAAWIKPDERDRRELVNRRGAIAIRNALLQILPADIIEDALNACQATTRAAARQDLQENREDTIRKLVMAFDDLGVSQAMIETRLGHKSDLIDADELDELRGVWHSLKDGNTSRKDHFEVPAAQAEGVADLNAMVDKATGEVEVEQLCAVPDCGKPKREHKSNQLKHSFASPDLWGGTDDEEQEDPA